MEKKIIHTKVIIVEVTSEKAIGYWAEGDTRFEYLHRHNGKRYMIPSELLDENSRFIKGKEYNVVIMLYPNGDKRSFMDYNAYPLGRKIVSKEVSKYAEIPAESRLVEWKQSFTSLPEISKQVASFANSFKDGMGEEGLLYIGFEEVKTPHGEKRAKLIGLRSSIINAGGTTDDLECQSRNNLYQNLGDRLFVSTVRYEWIGLDTGDLDKVYCIVHVPIGYKKPILYKATEVWMRVGNTSSQMKGDELIDYFGQFFGK